jgi:acetyl-CoA C-acetyltransferase
MESVVIVSAVRTPIGAFNGGLSQISAPRLGALVISEAISRARVEKTEVDEVIMGNVLTAGVGQAPARQSALFAELSNSTPCLTINKVCGSGLKAVMLGAQSIQTGDSEIVVAGGQENMSQTPHLLEKSRAGFKMGNVTLSDSMIKDGLWDVYNNFHMGSAAELCAREKSISRDSQDAYAAESFKRAQLSVKEGFFKNEIVPVKAILPGAKEETLLSEDEGPFKVKFDKIATLKPAFEKTGSVTAANSSTINDGAAALVLMSESIARKRGLKPLAKIIGHTSAAHAPEWFTTAPAKAMTKLLSKTGLAIGDIDLFEINEAFAVVAIATMEELKLDPQKVNVQGGAVALGHPIGASGARILTTLVHSLHRLNKKRGMVSICIGGGEACAMIIEKM